jgi:hypothetical protein
MQIEIETWPESAGWPEPGPANTPPSAEGEGRWRLIHVVLSAHDARTEQVTNEGQQDA